MLQVKNISKTYVTGDLKQVALNNVSLNFRECEFVSILGTSGSGKTTLLNIIGGLDHYDDGDLIINNVSTKKYKDRDWDSYRNHSIGFVFQSYNLIPHQTILENVELALTIGGVSKKGRRKKALDALEKVGLKEQAHKKPNQMSGGQMQRVAIARALINNPSILLADEPTGALDSETSIQVMDLLKEVAQDRLVIMVTHNPDLAKKYSTRIVKLSDGKIIGDSNPFEVTEKEKKIEYKNLGKASMSLPTAFSLSFNNLLTKKGRTFLTAFAGSIGIIGIALILALSTGFQNYIDKVQEDALTSYPLSVTKETTDTTSILLSAMSSGDDTKVEEGHVRENQNISNMFLSVGYNDLKSFKSYIEKNDKEVKNITSYVSYTYSVNPLIYSKNTNDELIKVNPSSTLSTLMSAVSSSMSMSVFAELPDDDKMFDETYTLIEGKKPSNYDELLIVLPDESHISDLLLYTLGLKDDQELSDMLSTVMSGGTIESTSEPLTLSYDDLMNIELKLILPTSTYKYNSDYNIYEDMSGNTEFMKNLYNNSTKLKIVGIATLNSDNVSSSMMAGVGYTGALVKHIINESSKTDMVKTQLENKNINVITNKEFGAEEETSSINFEDMISIDTNALKSAFGLNIDKTTISNMTQGYMNEISEAITADTTEANKDFTDNLTVMTTNMLNNYIDSNGMNGIVSFSSNDVSSIVDNYLSGSEAQSILSLMESKYVITADVFKSMYAEIMKGILTAYIQTSSADPTYLAKDYVEQIVTGAVTGLKDTINTIAVKMVEANMQKTILTKVGELTQKLTTTIASSFKVDQEKIASAFKFNMDEDELMRLMSTLYSTNETTDITSVLTSLGYQDLDDPTAISFYFKDFDSKEEFLDFIDKYNDKQKDEDKKISYTDVTGILISSVKVIVDSVSYVLIAFVSISLVVSSIMIGIITYISVLERTKEIGILRAIGASKHNISSIFNAETFIIGLLSGLIGVGISLLLIIPINKVIHDLTNNMNITAILEIKPAIILIVLSIVLTLIGGLIPSKAAAKKDPVLALRTE